MKILAIDPGNTESGFVLINSKDCKVLDKGKVDNQAMRRIIMAGVYDLLVIEMVASYGMAVGKEVFETCVWIGRFLERSLTGPGYVGGSTGVDLVFRRDVKLHHCESAKAKDANIVQALIDRFAPGSPNFGKGTKADPGWFYGFRADIWQAYALAVYAADMEEAR